MVISILELNPFPLSYTEFALLQKLYYSGFMDSLSLRIVDEVYPV